MGESLLITLREGFEAALVVAIVLAAVKRSDQPEQARWVWIGTAAALAVSLAAGLIIYATVDDLRGVARMRTFAVICLVAAALLTWMIFWMRKHARSLRGELEGRTQRALEQSPAALALVAFAAVAREGLETALFLISGTTSSSAGDVVGGGLIGLAIAIVLGVVIYKGSNVFPLRRFFQITGVLIILFAAGLLSRFVLFLQSAGDLGTVNGAVYNLTGIEWLTTRSQVGRFLGGIFGWDPRPSFEQVIVYLGYLIPSLVLFFRPPAPRSTAPSPPLSASPTAPSAR